MRGIFFLGLIAVFLIAGIKAPYFFVLGYVWASILTPQFLAYSVITSLPISLIFGGASLFSLLFRKKEVHEVFTSQQIVLLIFAAWMTLTLLWAEVPNDAFVKWDSAIKTVAFCALMPMFFRRKLHLELLVWVIVLSGVAHCLPFGVKVLLSGGGYGVPLGLVMTNRGLGEGSTMAMFAVILIPFCLFLYRHQTILPYPRLVKLALLGFALACVLTSIGTYARTGLISLVVLGGLLLLKTKNIFRNIFLVIALVVAAYFGVEDGWIERMLTIQDGTEASAMGRVAVWMWVLEYIPQNPWGGSFGMYRINSYDLLLPNGEYLSVAGKAFHSIYFEVLGETGIPGLVMYFLVILLAYRSLVVVRRKALGFGLQDLSALAEATRIALVVYLVAGLFIGVAFQFFLYYLVVISAVLINLVRLHESKKEYVEKQQ